MNGELFFSNICPQNDVMWYACRGMPASTAEIEKTASQLDEAALARELDERGMPAELDEATPLKTIRWSESAPLNKINVAKKLRVIRLISRYLIHGKFMVIRV